MTGGSSVPAWATPRRTLLAVVAFLVSLAALTAADMWLETMAARGEAADRSLSRP